MPRTGGRNRQFVGVRRNASNILFGERSGERTFVIAHQLENDNSIRVVILAPTRRVAKRPGRMSRSEYERFVSQNVSCVSAFRSC